jgi:acyl-CoA reductase-like NAD-dependent aldehyde dehydrogenase
MGQVERAQVLFEKGPITAVAAFFAIAFFVALYLLLRAKDKHQTSQAVLQANQAKEIARLMEKHGDAMAALHTEERDRAIKHEVTMSNYLDMMDDVRFIAFEMRRVKQAREKKQRTTGEFEAIKGDPDGKVT